MFPKSNCTTSTDETLETMISEVLFFSEFWWSNHVCGCIITYVESMSAFAKSLTRCCRIFIFVFSFRNEILETIISEVLLSSGFWRSNHVRGCIITYVKSVSAFARSLGAAEYLLI